jgi:signal transduction histidine kinase
MGVEIYYGIPGLVGSAVVLSLIGIFLFYASPSRGRLSFLSLALAAFIYLLADGLTRLSAAGGDPVAAGAWNVVRFMGVAFLPVAMAFLAASYPRPKQRRWLDMVLIGSLAFGLAMCALRVLTPLVVAETRHGPATITSVVGPAFYAFVAYGLALSLFAMALFEQTRRQASSRLTRRNARFGFIGTALPFCGSAVYFGLFQSASSPAFDPIVPMITISMALYAAVLLSHEAPTSSLAAIRAIFSALPDALLIVNPSGMVTYANPAAERMLSRAQAPLEGVPAQEALRTAALTGGAGQTLLERYMDVREGRREQLVFTFEVPSTPPRAYSAVIAATDVGHSEEAGSALSMLSISARFVFLLIHDETDIHAKEIMLLKANEVKDLFISMIGHDLKAPLGAISGYSELIALDSQNSPEALAVYRYSQQILDSSRIIQLMMENARTFSRLVDPQDILRAREPTNLKSLLVREVSNLRGAADRKRVQVALHAEGKDEDFTVLAAPILRNVFQNLIDNAIKYTADASQVSVRLAREGTSVVVTVEDQGPGIPPDKREAIFRKFTRLDQTRTKTEGLGLGLPLSKQIVELHGGIVTPQPRSDGKPGAAFVVRLPMGTPAPEAAG